MRIHWIEDLASQGLIKKLPVPTHPIIIGNPESLVAPFSLKQPCVPMRFLKQTLAVNDSTY